MIGGASSIGGTGSDRIGGWRRPRTDRVHRTGSAADARADDRSGDCRPDAETLPARALVVAGPRIDHRAALPAAAGDAAFLTQVIAAGFVEGQAGERRSRRDPGVVLGYARAAYGEAMRLGSTLEPGFFGERSA